MWHRIFKGHWFTPNITRYDKYGFGEYDGCKICLNKEASDER